jgi:hypothetical protein
MVGTPYGTSEVNRVLSSSEPQRRWGQQLQRQICVRSLTVHLRVAARSRYGPAVVHRHVHDLPAFAG